MPKPERKTVVRRLVEDFAPKLAELTDDVPSGDVRTRPELSPRDHNLVTGTFFCPEQTT